MQFDNASSQAAIFLRTRGFVRIGSFSPERIVEGPVLNIPLPSLHNDATYAVPALAISGNVSLGKMKVILRNLKPFLDPIETQLTIRFLE